ncbi:MAG: hypothetical protein J6Q48_06115 [Bacteroidaceae bacterium]|nr:hypothetical protein [Bacteroidaceae bacterium]
MENEVSVVVESTELAQAVEDKSALLPNNPFESKQALNDYFTMAKVLAGSTMVPQAYQGNPSNCLIALEQAARMNCSPLMVMQNLVIVKGKPSWSGQACSMIVNGCGLFESVKLNYVGEKGKDNWGAFVSAIKKEDGEEVIGSTVDMAMAKAEGWTSNPKWKSMPEQMLGYRAYAFFARLHCPNALSGFHTEGEVEDIESNNKQRNKLTELLKGN